MFVLEVAGMGCGSCVSKITKAIQTLDSQAKVEVDRAAGKVRVESDEHQEDIRSLIEELGYPTKIGT
ncbi:heavy-metal-associated domain-containing protein [Pseudomonas paeninsulae]|jgi:copper chaperone|uniref:heavy-metal-associated domain-containing protein n=1 Tax=Pseudomonas paeninsulae TaxID=3110772 RepID=UPI002D77EF7A|nr:heavy-metal-associated domain-containing protein [Pseudomonas sp. IT1137]